MLHPPTTAGFFMNPDRDVDARLERVKALWKQIAKTPKTSARCNVLADEIRAEAAAYLAGVSTAIAEDQTQKRAERRVYNTAQQRVERRQSNRSPSAD
jgi:hypothetical protein